MSEQTDLLIDKAWDHIRDEDYDKAVAIFSQILENDQHCVRALNGRTIAYYYLDKADLAVQDLQAADAIDPLEPSTCFTRGWIFMRIGRQESAIEQFSIVLRSEPDHVAALLNRAECHEDLKQHHQALEDLDAAFAYELDQSDRVRALFHRGIIHFHLRKAFNAIDDLTQVLELATDHPDANWYRGLACLNSNQYSKALADFHICVEQSPKDPDAYTNRGLAYRSLGDDQNSQMDFEQAKKLGNEGPIPLPLKQTPPERIGLELMDILPAEVQLQYEEAWRNYFTESKDKAVRIWKELARKCQSVHLCYLVSQYLQDNGQNREAIKWAKKAVQINSHCGPAYNVMANAYRELKRPRKAIATIKQGLSIAPKHGNTYGLLGRIQIDKKQYQKAITTLLKAIENGSNSYHNLAVAYQHARQKGMDFNKARKLGLHLDQLFRAAEAMKKIDHKKAFADLLAGR